jgi:hypothetical protein
VYEVIAVPPLLAGAVNGTFAVAVETVKDAVPIVGAPATAQVVTAVLAALAAPVPTELVAVTVYVYDVPFAPPVADIGEVAPVKVEPPLRVTVKLVIACPPINAGAVNATDCVPTPVLVALTAVGAPGTAYVVIELLAAEAAPVPIAFAAVTVNVYAVFCDSPVTLIVPEPACESVPVPPEGLDVAVYEVIAVPPLLTGAVYETVAVEPPVVVATPIVGAPGTANVVIELLAAEAAPVPTLLVAVTVNV